MPTAQYYALANVTLSSSAATVTFSSISQAYRDLMLVVNGKSTSTQTQTVLNFNNDTAANYAYVYMRGDGSTTGSAAYSGEAKIFTDGSAGFFGVDFGQIVFNCLDYSASDKHKTVLIRTNVATGSFPGTVATAGRWASTAAITSLKVTAQVANFAAGSTFALYGVK